ncbi:MAG: helix-turn-helix domain-containing protein [Bacilli bacterium]|nr:helix-turn-helix domain-containing protein [Bacilli bacterium]
MIRNVFNVKETATYLHSSESHIRNLVRKNVIPYFRLGNKIMFDKSIIDDWLTHGGSKPEYT